MSQIYKNFK